MQPQPLKCLVPFCPVVPLYIKSIKGQQLVGRDTGHQPSLFHDWDPLDVGVHHLGGADGLTREERQNWVWGVATQRCPA